MRVRGSVRKRPAGTENPKLPTGDVEVGVDRSTSSTARWFRRSGSTSTTTSTRICAWNTATSTCAARGCSATFACATGSSRAIRDYLRRARFRRNRDADADQVDARRRARLSRAQPHLSGRFLRAAAVAADAQADPDDRGLRPLHADRALHARRRPARRPAAGVHASRRRDVVRQRKTTCSR